MPRPEPQTTEDFKKILANEHRGLKIGSYFYLAISVILFFLLVFNWAELGDYVYEIGLVFLSGGIPLAGVRIVWISASFYGIYKYRKANNIYNKYLPEVEELTRLLNSETLTDDLTKDASTLIERIQDDGLELWTKWF